MNHVLCYDKSCGGSVLVKQFISALITVAPPSVRRLKNVGMVVILEIKLLFNNFIFEFVS